LPHKFPYVYSSQDERYVRPAHLLGVVDLGRDLFVKHIIRPPIKDHVINAILGLLYIERKGYVINRSAIKNCVDTLLQLSDSSDGITMYKRDIEPQILRQTEAYYEAEARELLETCSTLEYLRRVNLCPLLYAALGPFTRLARFKRGSLRKSHAFTNVFLRKPSLHSRLLGFSRILF